MALRCHILTAVCLPAARTGLRAPGGREGSQAGIASTWGFAVPERSANPAGPALADARATQPDYPARRSGLPRTRTHNRIILPARAEIQSRASLDIPFEERKGRLPCYTCSSKAPVCQREPVLFDTHTLSPHGTRLGKAKRPLPSQSRLCLRIGGAIRHMRGRYEQRV